MAFMCRLDICRRRPAVIEVALAAHRFVKNTQPSAQLACVALVE